MVKRIPELLGLLALWGLEYIGESDPANNQAWLTGKSGADCEGMPAGGVSNTGVASSNPAPSWLSMLTLRHDVDNMCTQYLEEKNWFWGYVNFLSENVCE